MKIQQIVREEFNKNLEEVNLETLLELYVLNEENANFNLRSNKLIKTIMDNNKQKYELRYLESGDKDTQIFIINDEEEKTRIDLIHYVKNRSIFFQMKGNIEEKDNQKINYSKEIYIVPNSDGIYNTIFNSLIIKDGKSEIFSYQNNYKFDKKQFSIQADSKSEGFFEELAQLLKDKKEITTDFIDILNLTEDIKIQPPSKQIESFIIKNLAEQKFSNKSKELFEHLTEIINVKKQIKNKNKNKKS